MPYHFRYCCNRCVRRPKRLALRAAQVEIIKMPQAAPKPCRWPNCAAIVANSGYCDQHQQLRNKEVERQRESASKRGYGRAWQKASKAFLRAHPLCQCPDCLEGKLSLRSAQVVDHKVPHRGDMRLFWDSSNWQAMSKECHDRKTAAEDGGWGRPGRGG